MSVLEEEQRKGCIKGHKTQAAAFAAVKNELLGNGEATQAQVDMVEAILNGCKNGRDVWEATKAQVAKGGGNATQKQAVAKYVA
jgi:hypothetical protein